MGTVREIGKGRRTPPTAVTVGLIAHDAKKAELARFLRAHQRFASRFHYIAPEDTARSLDGLGLTIEVCAPDTLGGDLQVAAAVVEGRIDAVIFLHDPLAALPSESSLATILKVCDLEPIPLATNLATAEIVMHRIAAVPHGEERLRPVDEARLERVLVLTAPWSGEDDPAANR